MKFKANSYEILTSTNGTKLLLTVDKEHTNALRHWHNENTLQGDISVEIKKWSERRSLNANAYFHLLVNKLAEKLNIGNDEMKVKMVLEYGTIARKENGEEFVIKLPADADISQFYDYAKLIGQKIEKNTKLNYFVFYKKTSTLDTKEMARLIDGVIYECKELGIETITPSEKAKMLALWKSEGV